MTNDNGLTHTIAPPLLYQHSCLCLEVSGKYSLQIWWLSRKRAGDLNDFCFMVYPSHSHHDNHKLDFIKSTLFPKKHTSFHYSQNLK